MIQLKQTLVLVSAFAALVAITISRCPAGEPPPTTQRGPRVILSGAGGSFVGWIFQKLSTAYEKQHPSIKIDYQSEGNKAGIDRFQKEHLEFTALDVAAVQYSSLPKPDDYVYAPIGTLVVVVAYRLDGIKTDIILDSATLVDIFLGRIKKWSDAKLKQLNPGVNFPDQEITVVQPSVSSSATVVFTSYLSNTSDEWKRIVGSGSTVKWQTGTQTKQSVSIEIRATDGAIGFVSKRQASSDELKFASLRTQDSGKVDPTNEAVAITVVEASLGANPRTDLTKISRKGSYPLIGACVLVIARNARDRDAKVTPELKSFLEWCVTSGQDALQNDEIYPLPVSVRSEAKKEIANIRTE